MNTITVEEGIKRFFAGEPVKLMVSDTGRFEDLRPVDAQLYLQTLFAGQRMVFFEDEVKIPDFIKYDPLYYAKQRKGTEYKRHKGTPHRTQGENKPGDRPFDRLCREQEETGDWSEAMMKRLQEELVIYEEEEDDGK